MRSESLQGHSSFPRRAHAPDPGSIARLDLDCICRRSPLAARQYWLFILLVQRINRLTISNVLHMVGEQGRAVVDSMYPELTISPDGAVEPTGTANEQIAPPSEAITQVLRYYGGRLSSWKWIFPLCSNWQRQVGGVIEVTYAVGDVVADGSRVLNLRGGTSMLDEAALRSAIVLGFEWTIEQDPRTRSCGCWWMWESKRCPPP